MLFLSNFGEGEGVEVTVAINEGLKVQQCASASEWWAVRTRTQLGTKRPQTEYIHLCGHELHTVS